MKREIEFRGKRVDGKGWAHGSLLLPHAGNDSMFIIGWNGSDFEVNPDTIGQYTGLTDRNGVKVYEGDVNEDGGVVIWNASDASFCWDYPSLEVMSMGDEKTWCKVTGNIHESGGGEG